MCNLSKRAYGTSGLHEAMGRCREQAPHTTVVPIKTIDNCKDIEPRSFFKDFIEKIMKIIQIVKKSTVAKILGPCACRSSAWFRSRRGILRVYLDDVIDSANVTLPHFAETSMIEIDRSFVCPLELGESSLREKINFDFASLSSMVV